MTRSQAAVLGGLAVAALAALVLALASSQRGWGQDPLRLETEMASAQGVSIGTRVRVLGVPAGQVTQVVLPDQPSGQVLVRLELAAEHESLIRADGVVRVVRDGLVGERVLDIEPGTAAARSLLPGQRLLSVDPPDWEALAGRIDALVSGLERGEGTLGRLLANDEAYRSHQQLVARAQGAIANVEGIVQDLRTGKGTAGRLLADDEVHSRLVTAVERAEQVLAGIEEGHSAARQNWLVRSWLKDRYQFLVRPDATRHHRVFEERDLFDPGQAVLRDSGQMLLDEAAQWVRQFDDRPAEILVAAFHTDEPDGRLAQEVTQSQAQAVLDYLVDRHAVHKTGWFSRRSIDARGFGNLPDPTGSAGVSPRRIEILAFVK